MKTLTLVNIKNANKWLLPAGILIAGLVTVAVGPQAAQSSKAAVTQIGPTATPAQSSESAAPSATATPSITVNGLNVPLDQPGARDVTLPSGGRAHVDVSGNSTQITTSDTPTGGGSASQANGNLNVNLSTTSTGGTSWGSTQIYGNSVNSSNGSWNSNNTSIFSTGTNQNVSVSQ